MWNPVPLRAVAKLLPIPISLVVGQLQNAVQEIVQRRTIRM
jgi:hypothetical protein